MEPKPKTLIGPILLWIFTLGGAAVMVKGVLWAVYADSSVNRSGNDLADLGVLIGIGIALLGGLVLLLALFGLVRSGRR